MALNVPELQENVAIQPPAPTSTVANDPSRATTPEDRARAAQRSLEQEQRALEAKIRETESARARAIADQERFNQNLLREKEQFVAKQKEIERLMKDAENQQLAEEEVILADEVEVQMDDEYDADGVQDFGDIEPVDAPVEEPTVADNKPKNPPANSELAVAEKMSKMRKDQQDAEIVKLKKELSDMKAAEEAKKDRKRRQQELELKRLEAEMAKLKAEQKALKAQQEPPSVEEYAHINENPFTSPLVEALSTFSIDVDAASYANTRRYLNSSTMPPPGAVRIEELVNYFDYTYPQPLAAQPFSINPEVSSCPWNPEHQLVHIGLKGLEIDRSELAASNLVFLIDVSGSMSSPNKLPLLKQSFSLLLDNLNHHDRVAMVVYAGAAGVVLPSTPASDKQTILNALNRLNAGGSTAGGAGIELAYNVAVNNLIHQGNNRVILATDGDFNVGPSSESALVKMIEERRDQGVFLSVLGFGTGNYKDSRMEQLADKGNGNYAYIDNLQEAQKVLVNEMGGTLYAIAKDVKIQIEFNPTHVKGYRLIGYENRVMAAQDFNDDTKDAGELGAGHTVTALYEVVPHSASTNIAGTDALKYQKTFPSNTSANAELMTVKFRYKDPDGTKSKLIEKVIFMGDKTLSATSDNYRFSAAVASFGMLLRGSRYAGTANYDMVLDLAKGAVGDDFNGYRMEFLGLVERAKLIDQRPVTKR